MPLKQFTAYYRPEFVSKEMIQSKGFVFGVAVVSAVGFLCYLNTLKAQFVYDDNRAILDNPDVLRTAPWSKIWQNDFWGTPLSHSGSHKSYRPITILTFKLNNMGDELNPKSYHVTNVLLHSLASGLVFFLAHSLFGSVFQSLVAGLLFAVHPVHTEAVSGIVGRADILSCIFFILSLVSYTKAANSANSLNPIHTPTKWRFVFLAILCSVVAMLSKEIGITALAVCLVHEVIFTVEPELSRLKETIWRAKVRGSLSRMSCLLLAAIFAVYWRLFIMDLSVPEFNDSDNPASVHPNVKVRFLTFSYLPVLNFYLLLFPWQLSFDWSMDAIKLITSFTDSRNLESLVLYSFLLFVSYRLARRIMRRSVTNASVNETSVNSACFESPQNTALEKVHKRLASSSHSIFYLWYFKLNCLLAKNGSTFSYESKSRLWNIDVNDNARHKQLLHESSARNGLKKRTKSSEDSSQSDDETSQCNFLDRHNVINAGCKRSFDRCFANGAVGSQKAKDNWLRGYGNTNKLVDPQNLYKDFDLYVFSLAILIIAYIPASNLFFYVGFVIAERILYIPSVGFCLLVSIAFKHVCNAVPRCRPVFLIAFMALIGLFTIRTIVRNEDWTNEESLYRSGIHINPAKAWGNLGNVLSGQGKLQEAEMAYRSALKSRPNMADTYYNLGILYHNTKRFKEAIECYKSAISCRPQLASAYLNLGLVFDELGNKSHALEVLQRGRSLSDHGLKNPKAHHHALTSIAHNIGKILFDIGKYKESIATFLDAINKMPESYSPHSLYNMLGQSYSFYGDKKHAEYWYLKSLKSNRTYVPSHLTYARHLASSGNSKGAEDWFLKAIKLQPAYPQSHFHYAEFLYNNNRLREALIAIEKSVQLNPNDVNAVLYAASCFREAKMYPKAEEYYRIAVKLNQADSLCHMNLGAFLHLTGRLDEAEASYKEALRLNPGDELTLENLRKLESMQVKRARTK